MQGQLPHVSKVVPCHEDGQDGSMPKRGLMPKGPSNADDSRW